MTLSLREVVWPRGTRLTWAARYQRLTLVLLAVSLLTMLITRFSTETAPIQLLSFLVNDEHCDPATQSFGMHCFGDFSIVREAFANGPPWARPDLTAAYPPLAWLPALMPALIGDQLLGGGRAGLVLYLLLACANTAVPAAWAARGRWRTDGVLRFLMLTFCAAPAIVLFDRGNTLAFTIPWLMMAGVGFLRDDQRLTFWGIVIATLIKPQFGLLVILPLCVRHYRLAITAALTAIAVTLGSFLVFGQNAESYAQNWLQSTVAYTTYQPLDVAFPYNLSAPRSLVTIFDLTVGSWLSGDQRQAVLTTITPAAQPASILLAIVIALAVVVGGRRVPRFYLLILSFLIPIYVTAVTYHYYAGVLLPLAALTLRDPTAKAHSTDSMGTMDGELAHLTGPNRATIWVLGLMLAPIAIATSYPAFIIGPSASGGEVGLWQVLSGPVLLIYVIVLLTHVIGIARRSKVRHRHLPDSEASGSVPS